MPYLTENPIADFGITLVETDIDRLVLVQLARWLPTYLAQAERERSLPNRLLARPVDESYQNALEDTTFPDARLPGIVATTATTDEPQRRQGGAYAAAFDVTVSAIVRGRSGPETREIAAVFGGCVRSLLVHQQIDLDGEIHWTGGSVMPVPDTSDNGRWLAAGVNTFIVYADTVLSGDGPVIPEEGDPPYPPPDPDTDPDAPYDPLTTVWRAVTDITPRSS